MDFHFSPRAFASLLLLASGGLASRPLVAQSSDASASAAQRTQDIHFESLPDHPVDGNLIPLLATATSGLKVRFSVVSGPAQIIGSQLMLTGPGPVVIRASQPGDAHHAAATPVERSFEAIAPQSNAQAAAAANPLSDAAAVQSTPGNEAADATAATNSAPAPTLDGVSSPSAESSQTAPSSAAPSEAVADTPPASSTDAAPANPSSNANPISDLIPKALINAANLPVGPAAATQLPAKLTLTLPGNVEMVFVRVPGGRATLGSPPSETGHQPAEALHGYIEQQGFLMSATEVTQAQYEALTGERPSYFRSDWQTRPVEQVRFSDLASDANGFFAKLNGVLQSSGHAAFTAALPSDDQWEYACRAGTATAFNNRAQLSFPMNEGRIREVATYGQTETSAVASHAANAWGLYDMHGNVAEWTREGSLRGGSFRDSAAFIRSASKLVGKAGGDGERDAGFRVVLLQGAPGLDMR